MHCGEMLAYRLLPRIRISLYLFINNIYFDAKFLNPPLNKVEFTMEFNFISKK